jgi:hypothetical protein
VVFTQPQDVWKEKKAIVRSKREYGVVAGGEWISGSPVEDTILPPLPLPYPDSIWRNELKLWLCQGAKSAANFKSGALNLIPSQNAPNKR